MTNPNTKPRALAAILLGVAAAIGLLAGVVLDRLVLLPRGAIAAESPAPETTDRRGPGEPVRRGPPPPDDRYLEFLSRELSLSAEQRAQVEEILQAQQERVLEITSQTRPQMRAVAQETRAAIDEVLTLEQRERVAELRARRDRMREAGGEGSRAEPHRGTRGSGDH
jgi:Spy/CpxP family protein refolding chaperone